MDDLIKEFIEETIESIGELDNDLVRLEQEPSNQDLLGKVFRLMHTIKGTCGFIGLQRLEKTAHSAENLLDKFRHDSQSINEISMTMLFMAIDRVRYLIHEIHKNQTEPAGNDADITSLIDNYLAADEQPAPVCETPVNSAPQPETHTNETITALLEPEIITPTPQVKETAPPADHHTTPSQEKGNDYLRVPMNVLEDMINMVSELVLTRNQLLQLVRMEDSSSLKTPLQKLNRIVSDLQDSVMKTRMQPIGNAWAKLPRIVRDLSTELKKKISLEMEGEETELDRQVLELIKDPLTHMVRNSCDHGVETPAERAQNGKKEQGTIKLQSYHEGGFVVIKISDDGRGLDAQKIARKAVEKGLIEPDKLDKLNEKQILSLIMRPGFSTADTVSNISGRGVGMDVVRANIEKIGGSIDMESQAGKGTCFTIHIPLTLAIISALIVDIDGYRYALPQMNIQELVSVQPGDHGMMDCINGKPVLRLRDKIISLLNADALFDRQTKSEQKGEALIAVTNAGSVCYGILVDHIHDTEEVVIKSVSSALKKTGIYAGNTILGDGQVIMILDPVAIARRFNIQNDQSHLDNDQSLRSEKQRSLEKASMLVIKSGSGANKAIPLALVSRLQMFKSDMITSSADKIVVNYNNNLIQLFPVEDTRIDEGTDITSLILSDDRSDSAMGLIIDSIIDIVEGDLDIAESTARPGILGSMILGDHTVDVIDIAHYLQLSKANWFATTSHSVTPYATHHHQPTYVPDVVSHQPTADIDFHTSHHSPRSKSSKVKLLVVDDSNFFRAMLSNILKAAGYDVIAVEDPFQAIKLHEDGYMFDIILSDIEMPGMDGFQFVEKMKLESFWKEIPFVAITSHNTPKDIEYGFKKGFSQYIPKLNKDELLSTLSKVMN